MPSVEISRYDIAKYLLYVDCMAIVVAALMLYADDDEELRTASEDAQVPAMQRLKNTGLLFLNASAPFIIYTFAFDGFLYKVVTFIGILTLSMFCRLMFALSFGLWWNMINITGIVIGGYMLMLVHLGQLDKTVIDIPVGGLMQVKVDRDGNTVSSVTTKDVISGMHRPSRHHHHQRYRSSMSSLSSSSSSSRLSSSSSSSGLRSYSGSHSRSKSRSRRHQQNSRQSSSSMESPPDRRKRSSSRRSRKSSKHHR